MAVRPLAALAAAAAAVAAGATSGFPADLDNEVPQATPGFPSNLDNEIPQALPGGAASGWGVQVTATTRDQALVLARQPALPLLPAGQQPAADVQISVDTSQRFQPIVGFGAALTDASAYAIFRAPPKAQEALLKRLFGPPQQGGVKLSVLRLTVGVSDFSVSYGPNDITYDEVTDKADDYNLEHFSTTKDDAFLLPMIRRILAINPDIVVMASPWTAPLWMKTASGSLGEGWLRDTPEVFAAYADYLVRYLEDYNRKGVRIHYLTLQNEPGHGKCGEMPCMLMSPDQQIRLAQQVGQRLRASSNANISATKLLAYDHNWGPDDGPKQKKDWNSWLVVLLIAPVPLICGLCSILAFLIWRLWRGGSRARYGSAEEGEEDEDGFEEEEDGDYDPKHSLDHSGFALGVGPPVGSAELDSSDLENSGSDTESDAGYGIRGLVFGRPGFLHGVCLGGFVMLLASWATSLLTANLVRSGKVSDKALVDDLSQTFNGPNWPAAVLMSAAGPEFAGVAWHCYGGDPKVQSKLQERIAPVRQQPTEQHMTECSGGDWSGPWEGSLVWNQKVLIMGTINNHGRSVLQWNLALDENKGPHCSGGACCKGCRGVVTVPSMAGSIDDITYNVEFVGLAHHSLGLSPGAHRIFAEVSPEEKVHAVAYRNADGSQVLVAVNEDEVANASLLVSTGSSSFWYNLAPGVATFKW